MFVSKPPQSVSSHCLFSYTFLLQSCVTAMLQIQESLEEGLSLTYGVKRVCYAGNDTAYVAGLAANFGLRGVFLLLIQFNPLPQSQARRSHGCAAPWKFHISLSLHFPPCPASSEWANPPVCKSNGKGSPKNSHRIPAKRWGEASAPPTHGSKGNKRQQG